MEGFERGPVHISPQLSPNSFHYGVSSSPIPAEYAGEPKRHIYLLRFQKIGNHRSQDMIRLMIFSLP